MRAPIAPLLATVLVLCSVTASSDELVRAVSRATLLRKPEPSQVSATHQLKLTLVVLSSSGWSASQAELLFQQAANLLAQCGIVVDDAELIKAEVPSTHRHFYTPNSRNVVRALQLPKPTVYLAADTWHRPAFEAEAIGRLNSRKLPDLADTVWITRAVRDPGIALAHEIVHLLMDKDEHSDEPNNVMQPNTNPANTRLSATQCASAIATGIAYRLLTPIP